MVSKTIGIIFHANPNDIDGIVLDFEKKYNIDITCVKSSWGKLWIKEGDAP